MDGDRLELWIMLGMVGASVLITSVVLRMLADRVEMVEIEQAEIARKVRTL